MKWDMEKLAYKPAQSRPQQYGYTEYWCGNCYYCKRTEFIVLNGSGALFQAEREAFLKREMECRTRFQRDPIQTTLSLKNDFEDRYGYFERDPTYIILMFPADVG
jgi:hypothetical protein